LNAFTAGMNLRFSELGSASFSFKVLAHYRGVSLWNGLF
jgi:hypothetical protein